MFHYRTTIVIAHRLSTIRHADKIAVINEGKVAELGTHEELMEKNGIYANMVRLQMETENQFAEQQSSEANEEQAEEEVQTIVEKNKEEEKKDTVSFKRIFLLSKPEWMYMLIGCFAR